MLLTKLNLDPDEKILLEVRKHWIVLLWRYLLLAVLAFVPAIGFIAFIAFVPARIVNFVENYTGIAFFLYFLWLLFLWTICVLQWTIFYYLDVWYITEKRIIDVDQKNVFHREVVNLRFDKIQDISIVVRGVIATFLKYGDLHVQTAAEDSGDFVMKNAAHPEDVRRVIFARHNFESERVGRSGVNKGL